MYPVFTGVMVTKKQHPRYGQAGHVCAYHAENEETVAVKFDNDGAEVEVSVENIRVL